MLLGRNPFGVRSCKLPKEKNPRRPVMTDEQFHALLSSSRNFDWRFRLALILANETGHRQSAIRGLRWSDVDFEARTIRWRSEHEKTGYEHVTPLSQRAVDELAAVRGRCLGIGDAWVFPSPRSPDRPLSRNALDRWLYEAQKLAGLDSLGWHSIRRKFASELRHIPLKDLCELGGWKDPKTILTCYQMPDQSELRESLKARRPFGAEPSNSTVNSTDKAPRRAPLSTVTSLS